MKTIITSDESWVCGFDPETKAQSSQRTTLRPKKAQVQSEVEVMLIVFFHHKGIVHHEYTPDGQTVIKEYYVQVLNWVRDVQCKQPAPWIQVCPELLG